MTLQSSGQITISDINTEFGNSGETQLSDYYGDEPSLPTSGEITLSDFYGLTAVTVTVNNADQQSAGGGAIRTGSLSFLADGTFGHAPSPGLTGGGNWASNNPNTNGADYQMRVTTIQDTGNALGSTTISAAVNGVWGDLSATRTVSVSVGGTIGNFHLFSGTVEIREGWGAQRVLGSGNWSITVVING